MTTIRDVARQCGLSAMTVSAVLNGRAGAASDQTRARVLRTAREMGYHPNAVARGLSRKRMDTLGVVMVYDEKPSLTADRYLGAVLDGVLMEDKRRHQRTLIIAEDTWAEVRERLPSYGDGRCDGLVFLIPTSLLPSEALLELRDRRRPFVLVGESRPEPGLPAVDLDNVAAARAATAHVLECGHRRTALLGGDPVHISVAQREEGYRAALRQYGLTPDKSLILRGGYSEASGMEQARCVLSRPSPVRPTALVCGDDWIALGALRVLTEMGMRVPGDVSLVGINDDPEAQAARPALTTVRQPFAQLGARAVELVLDQINGVPAPGNVLLPGELIVRDSVAPPAGRPT